MVLVGGVYVAFCTANDILPRYLFCVPFLACLLIVVGVLVARHGSTVYRSLRLRGLRTSSG